MKKTLILLLILPMLALLLNGCSASMLPASWPGITVNDQVAYVAGGTYVFAVDLTNGTEVWRFPAKGSASKTFYAAPVLTPDGQLIIGGFDHILYSVNPQTGVENWEFKTARDRWIGAVVVVDNTIYAPNADYKLYAVNLDGTLKWSFLADQSIWGAPATDGMNVYFGTLGRKIYAVNAQTGAEVWVQTLKGAVLGSPVIGAENELYAAGFDGSLVALNKTTGAILWQQLFEGRLWATPVLDGNTLYFGDYKGSLYAFDITTQTSRTLAQHGSPILGTPLLMKDSIAFGAENATFYVVGTNGSPIWQQTIAGKQCKLYGSPVAAGNLILIAPFQGDNTLVALDQTGAQRWVFTPSK